MVFLSRKGPTDPHADRLLGYPHRHNLSACSALICMFYPRVRPPFASRPPSTGSAICCEQIATHERTSTHSVQNSPNTPPASSPPGTKLSEHAQKGPFQPVLHEQGELCTAPSAKPGTKLSKHAPTSSPPGTKLSQRPRSTAVPRKSSPSTPHTTTEPRKSSPSTPKNGVFRLFRACRANFFALTPTSGRAGRTYSRRGLDRTR